MQSMHYKAPSKSNSRDTMNVKIGDFDRIVYSVVGEIKAQSWHLQGL